MSKRGTERNVWRKFIHLFLHAPCPCCVPGYKLLAFGSVLTAIDVHRTHNLTLLSTTHVYLCETIVWLSSAKMTRHAKFTKSEKAKTKLKGNKLAKGLNVTKTEFKIKKIIIRDQIRESVLIEDGTEIRSQNIKVSSWLLYRQFRFYIHCVSRHCCRN